MNTSITQNKVRWLTALACAIVPLAGCATDAPMLASEPPGDALPDSDPAEGGQPDFSIPSWPPAASECSSDMQLCDGACVAVSVHADHCGACNNACESGQRCNDGICNRHAWSDVIGGEYEGGAMDVAVAPNGDVIAVGSYDGTLRVDGTAYPSRAGSDIFVLKLGAGGRIDWLRTFGDEGAQSAYAVDVDDAGRIAVVGRFEGAMHLTAAHHLMAAGDDAFVMVLNGEGDPVWGERFGDAAVPGTTPVGTEMQQATAVAFDTLGNVVVTGSFFGSIDLGTKVVNAVEERELFVAKLDARGEVMWAVTDTQAGTQAPMAIAVSARDDIVVAGWFTDMLGLSPQGIVAAGSSDAFVAVLSSEGQVRWVNAYGDAAPQMATAVAVDPSTGDVLVSGSFGETELFVARLAIDNGRSLNGAAFVGEGTKSVHDIAVTPNGQVLLAGSFNGGIDFGLGDMVSSDEDAFVARLDAGLQGLWSQRFGGALAQSANGLAARNEHAIVAGSFSRAIDLGGGITCASGESSAFLAAFAP